MLAVDSRDICQAVFPLAGSCGARLRPECIRRIGDGKWV